MNKPLHKQLLAILFFIAIIGKIQAQVFPVEIINYSGAPNEVLNIVIMGDGYTLSQQDKFIQDSKNAFNGFFAQAPFSTYKDSINIYAIKVVSNASGASLDPNKLIDNYFGSSFWSYGIERLLVAWNYSKISGVLNSNTPFYDEAVIIVNDAKYGGSGGDYAVFSTHSQAIELLLHEFGHSFGRLADEYWAGDQYAAEKTNMTQDNNPATIRWKDFLNVNSVGIYPYDESPTWFRPHQNCKMRYLGSPFCEVCKNKISNDVQFIANTDTLYAPIVYFAANTIDIEKGTSVEFYDFSTNRPKSWEWTFDGGTPASSTEKNPTVTYSTVGEYSVTLKVTNEQGNNTVTKTNYIKVSTPTSDNRIDYSNAVSVFPNPANNVITVSSNLNLNSSQFRIINSTGSLVKQGEIVGSIEISDLSPGMYILLLDYKNNMVSQKFIKQ